MKHMQTQFSQQIINETMGDDHESLFVQKGVPELFNNYTSHGF